MYDILLKHMNSIENTNKIDSRRNSFNETPNILVHISLRLLVGYISSDGCNR